MEDQEAISFLTQQQAAEIDDLLMGHLGFSIDQLMELAGLSVASAIAEVYKPSKYNRVLVMETTVVMVLLPLVICIILDISRAFVFPNVPQTLFFPVFSLSLSHCQFLSFP